jgi:YHS domain-containing protein
MIPVAYFTMSKAVRGDKAITADHGGATYHFVSQDHKALFEADPPNIHRNMAATAPMARHRATMRRWRRTSSPWSMASSI